MQLAVRCLKSTQHCSPPAHVPFAEHAVGPESALPASFWRVASSFDASGPPSPPDAGVKFVEPQAATPVAASTAAATERTVKKLVLIPHLFPSKGYVIGQTLQPGPPTAAPASGMQGVQGSDEFPGQ